MSTKTIKQTFVNLSSNGKTKYQTLLYTDGTTSCDCPGWTRRTQGDGSRTCKHVRLIEAGVEIAEKEAMCYRAVYPAREAPALNTDGRAFDFAND